MIKNKQKPKEQVGKSSKKALGLLGTPHEVGKKEIGNNKYGKKHKRNSSKRSTHYVYDKIKM